MGGGGVAIVKVFRKRTASSTCVSLEPGRVHRRQGERIHLPSAEDAPSNYEGPSIHGSAERLTPPFSEVEVAALLTNTRGGAEKRSRRPVLSVTGCGRMQSLLYSDAKNLEAT